MKSIIPKSATVFISLLLAAVWAGAQTDAAHSPTASSLDAGTISGTTYSSSYFGFELKFPSAWNVYDAQGRHLVIEEGKQELKSSDPKIQANIDSGIQKTVNLLTVSKLPQGQSSNSNAILACGAENIEGSGVTTGAAYLTSMKNLIKYASEKYEIESDVSSEVINGSNFGVLTLKIVRPDVVIHQKYFATVAQGYALFFISTYVGEADRQLMESAAHSFRFK